MKALKEAIHRKISSLENDIGAETNGEAENERLQQEVLMLKELANIAKRFNTPNALVTYLQDQQVESTNLIKDLMANAQLITEAFRLKYNITMYHLNEFYNLMDSLTNS